MLFRMRARSLLGRFLIEIFLETRWGEERRAKGDGRGDGPLNVDFWRGKGGADDWWGKVD
jgi:hypothetical protein